MNEGQRNDAIYDQDSEDLLDLVDDNPVRIAINDVFYFWQRGTVQDYDDVIAVLTQHPLPPSVVDGLAERIDVTEETFRIWKGVL